MTDDAPRTQFPGQTSRPRDSVGGDARIIVARDSVDAVRAVNRANATADDLARRSNPDATPAPRATDMIAVYDIGSRAFHFILLHRLDPKPPRSLAVGKVVVFSDPQYAPGRTVKLQLATPGYYRDQEDLQPGIRDPHDGLLAKDGSPRHNPALQPTASLLRGLSAAELGCYEGVVRITVSNLRNLFARIIRLPVHATRPKRRLEAP